MNWGIVLRRRWSHLIFAGIALSLASGTLAAGPPAPAPYIDTPNERLGYALPPPPTTGLDVERSQVLAAQLSASPSERQEAYDDAEAYLPDQLMQRFSLVAGETLTRAQRPVFAHMLFRLWRNVDGYTSYLKGLNVRDRPFMYDPGLQPCDLSFLQPSDNRSYPSGHSTDGYAAALLIIDVQKGNAAAGERDRADLLLARGARFGTNRMVCGVHYPSDVFAGQAFASFLYAKVAATADFKQDLACARMEDLAARKGTLGKPASMTADCWTESQTYATESHSP